MKIDIKYQELRASMTTKKFHYVKFEIIQIGVEALSQTQIPSTPKYKTKEPKVHKY